MSEGEMSKGIYDEIEEIYVFLTKGEPSPDDEIDARDLLINKFRRLSENPPKPDQKEQIKSILKKLEEWDTLDLWFLETSLPSEIEQLLQIPGKIPPKVQQEDVEGTPSLKEEEDIKPEKPEINIGDIVDKVSQQFKGEIDGLKDTIENLKKQLSKKEDAIKKISDTRKVQKITPKKEVKLPPPVIKIPVIKRTPFPKDQVKKSKPSTPPATQTPKIPQVKMPPLKDKKDLTPIPLKPVELEQKKPSENALTPIPVKKPEISTTVSKRIRKSL